MELPPKFIDQHNSSDLSLLSWLITFVESFDGTDYCLFPVAPAILVRDVAAIDTMRKLSLI